VKNWFACLFIRAIGRASACDQKPSKFPLNNKRKTQKTGSNNLRFSFFISQVFQEGGKRSPLLRKNLQDQEKFPKSLSPVSEGKVCKVPPLAATLLNPAAQSLSETSREVSLRKWQAYYFMEFKRVFALSFCSTCCSGKGYITTKFQLTFFISLLYFGSLQKTFRHPRKGKGQIIF